MTEELPPGATWFLRCADCHAMWVAKEGFQITTGTLLVAWFQPKTARKPTVCHHNRGVERWNGTSWVECRKEITDAGLVARGVTSDA